MSEQGPREHFPIEEAAFLLPSLVYLAGGVLAVVGLLLWPSHSGAGLIAMSAGASELGGAFARKLEVGSRFGQELDWALGSAVAAATAWCCLGSRAPLAVLALGCWEALARYQGWRVSGRAAVTAAALTAHFA